jgi:predicted RNase H-like HicB family nuclease
MKIELHIDYFEEDGVIVALSPELQVSSFGDTLAEAEKSIKEALELFIEGCETLGTLNEVLEESGFRKIGDEWILRKPIKTMKTTLQHAVGVASYA